MIIQDPRHTSSLADGKHDSHRVLIVDDEHAICFAYSRLLESERFGFDICDSVEAGIELLNSKQYFAVISDVRFAGSDNADGVYLVSCVRNIQPQAKVILVTGYGSEELKKTAEKLGVAHYLEKPIEPSLVLTLLRSLHLIADEEEENEYFKTLSLDKPVL